MDRCVRLHTSQTLISRPTTVQPQTILVNITSITVGVDPFTDTLTPVSTVSINTPSLVLARGQGDALIHILLTALTLILVHTLTAIVIHSISTSPSISTRVTLTFIDISTTCVSCVSRYTGTREGRYTIVTSTSELTWVIGTVVDVIIAVHSIISSQAHTLVCTVLINTGLGVVCDTGTDPLALVDIIST